MLWQVLKEKYLIIHTTFCMMDISGLILSDQEKNVDAFIKQVTSTTVMGSEPSVSSKLAQYFAELSYYFPISKRHHLLDLRCTLAIYQK